MVRHTAAAIALGLLLGLSGLSPAQTLEIENYGGPFFQYSQSGVWAQRSALVGNPTDRDRRVRIEYQATDADGSQVLFSRTAVVPAGCRRDILLSCESGLLVGRRRGNSDRGLPRAQMPMRLIDADTGQMIEEVPVEVSLLPEGEYKAAVLYQPTRNRDELLDEPDDYLYLQKLPSSRLAQMSLVRIALGSRPAPPDRWLGYDLFDMVILRRVEMQNLGSAELQALLDWTRRGGVLLICSSDVLDETLAGPLGSAAGAACTGGHRVQEVTLTRPGRPPVTAPLHWPAMLSHLCPDGAETLYEANGLPLLLRKPLGSGWVYTSALPLGAYAAEALQEVLQPLERALQVVPPVDPGQFAEPSERTLNAIAGRRAPSRVLAAGSVAGLAAVAMIAGLALMRSRRGARVWLLMIPLCVLGAIVVFAIGAARSSPPRLSHVGLVIGTGEGSAHVQEAFAYFAGPRQQTQTFRSDTARAAMYDTSRGAVAGLSRSRIRTDAQLMIPDRVVEPRSYATFRVDGLVSTPGLAVEMTFTGQGAEGRLDNRLPSAVTDAVLLTQRRTFRVGDLPVGSRDVEIGPADLLSRVQYLTRADQRGNPDARDRAVGDFTGQLLADTVRNGFVGELIARPGIQRILSRDPVLIGYTAEPLIRPTDAEDLPNQGWSVVVWPVKLTAPPPATRVLVPAGFTELEFIGAGLWNALTQSFNENNYPAEIDVQVSLPEVVRDLAEPAANLTVDMTGPDRILSIYGVRPDGSTQLLTEEVGPAGPVRVRAAEADAFRDSQGRLRFRLGVTDQSQQRKPGMTRTKWKINAVDVSVEGITP